MSYGSTSPSHQQQNHHDIYHYGYTANTYCISDGSTICGEESNFWSNSPRSTESTSPNNVLHQQNQIDSSSPSSSSTSVPSTSGTTYHNLYNTSISSNNCPLSHINPYSSYGTEYTVTTLHETTELGTPFVRVIKRRTTANKKERRRTQSINNAYADLRDCIPNVPADTKLSKIKTLRLATSYISYLKRALETDDVPGHFKAELNNLSKKSSYIHHHHSQQANLANNVNTNSNFNDSSSTKSDSSVESTIHPKKTKGRTGWPQHVWALELKQEQAL